MTRATSLQLRSGGFVRDTPQREQNDGRERWQVGQCRWNPSLAELARAHSKFADGFPSWSMRASRVRNVRRHAACVACEKCTFHPATVTCARSQTGHGDGATARDRICHSRRNGTIEAAHPVGRPRERIDALCRQRGNMAVSQPFCSGCVRCSTLAAILQAEHPGHAIIRSTAAKRS